MSDKEAKYYDGNGRECSLQTLCRREPEWAASRIQVMRDRLAAIERTMRELAVQLDKESFEMMSKPSHGSYGGGLARRDIAVVIRTILDNTDHK